MRFAERSAGEKLMCSLRPVNFIYAMGACLGCARSGSITARSTGDTGLMEIREKEAACLPPGSTGGRGRILRDHRLPKGKAGTGYHKF